LESVRLFNFRDGHVTTFQFSWAYIWQMPGHRLSRLAKVSAFVGATGLG